mmetsp:Transcript_94466/g.283118  ORF Transcript_94466/g.283118 Transcript_94466/m.283118 type:complete len:96 (+) Transcript_94466:353-640(+)
MDSVEVFELGLRTLPQRYAPSPAVRGADKAAGPTVLFTQTILHSLRRWSCRKRGRLTLRVWRRRTMVFLPTAILQASVDNPSISTAQKPRGALHY